MKKLSFSIVLCIICFCLINSLIFAVTCPECGGVDPVNCAICPNCGHDTLQFYQKGMIGLIEEKTHSNYPYIVNHEGQKVFMELDPRVAEINLGIPGYAELLMSSYHDASTTTAFQSHVSLDRHDPEDGTEYEIRFANCDCHHMADSGCLPSKDGHHFMMKVIHTDGHVPPRGCCFKQDDLEEVESFPNLDPYYASAHKLIPPIVAE